jgi:hypothetical protein
MASSSPATCRSSPAGSKVVREQGELVADRREALRRRLRRCSGGHVASEGNVPVPVLGIDVPARVILRALQTAEPLQVLVERLGRIADRLPGAARRHHD